MPQLDGQRSVEFQRQLGRYLLHGLHGEQPEQEQSKG